MILNHYKNASIISLFYPLSVFGFGMLDYPKPRTSYWNVIIYYTTVVIILKFITQFQFLGKQKFYTDFMDIMRHFKVGLRYVDDTFSAEFFAYIFYDIFVLFIVLIHQVIFNQIFY